MKDIVIIGGGASGIMTAISLKQNLAKDANVIIVERLEKIGKKILATGNGKCNFTNKNIDENKYNNPNFASKVIDKMNYDKLINYFLSMGLLSKELTEGRVYPYSESSSTVLEILRLELKRQNIEIKNNFDVDKITYKLNKYQIYNHNQRNYFIEADYLVFACGGASAEILGSNGSGYNLLKPWKVATKAIKPGLVGLTGDAAVLKQLSGIRFKANVSLFSKKTKNLVWQDYGEVQFKNDGISGIVIMQASSIIARNNETYLLYLDLIPNLTHEQLLENLNMRASLFYENETSYFLTGMLPKMLGNVILKKASVNLSAYINTLTKVQINKIANLLKKYPIDIKGNYGFEKSQVTIGGIQTSEIDNDTLKIKKMQRAYICGEMMDIDGECGGYNLHYAFASGYVVGKSIAMEINKDA